MGARGGERGRQRERARALEPFLSERRDEVFSDEEDFSRAVDARAEPACWQHELYTGCPFFSVTDDTSPRERATTAVAALASFLANAYTIHIARSSNDAPTRRRSVVLNDVRRDGRQRWRQQIESPLPGMPADGFLYRYRATVIVLTINEMSRIFS